MKWHKSLAAVLLVIGSLFILTGFSGCEHFKEQIQAANPYATSTNFIEGATATRGAAHSTLVLGFRTVDDTSLPVEFREGFRQKLMLLEDPLNKYSAAIKDYNRINDAVKAGTADPAALKAAFDAVLSTQSILKDPLKAVTDIADTVPAKAPTTTPVAPPVPST